MKTSYREAVRAGPARGMQADPRVFLMGEDVGRYGGALPFQQRLAGRIRPGAHP